VAVRMAHTLLFVLQYVDTKRMHFPRFFFVAYTDLLDILAKGTQDPAVMVHVPKLYDNFVAVNWDGTKSCCTDMVSGEGMMFSFRFSCSGVIPPTAAICA